MAHKAPGKAHRKGITLLQITEMFHDESTAEVWFTKQFWPNGPTCPYCKTSNVQAGIKHRTMTHRCRECPDRRMFSLKTGTVLEGSKLKYRVWAIAVYLLTTNLKGVSSLKLRRDLGISQKSAWHLSHRLRKTFESEMPLFVGPAEADETYVGWKRKNMPKNMRSELGGRGPVDMTAVAGIKDRKTNMVRAKVVEHTDRKTLQGFIQDNVATGSTLYTDDFPAYENIPNFKHESVKHSLYEYVRGDAHTQGIESFWSMLKRAHKGTFHRFSVKHLQRYVAEFAGRHNLREMDTLEQMGEMVRGMDGKRLRYRELVG